VVINTMMTVVITVAWPKLITVTSWWRTPWRGPVAALEGGRGTAGAVPEHSCEPGLSWL